MKKMILLFTLALCAGALNGMEVPKPQQLNYMGMLPQEIRKLIVLTLAQSSTVGEAIDAIRSLTETNKEFNTIINDPIITRAIIRILVQKFNAPSEYIAKKLSTLGSQQYINLSLQLKTRLFMKDFAFAENLIKAGADIDFQTVDIYPILCGSDKFIILLNLLNGANSIQATIAGTKQSLLNLEKMAMQSPEMAKRLEGIIKANQQQIGSYQGKLDSVVPNIHNMVQENKNIFKDDGQFNHFIAETNKENFKKAFAIIEPNTIMSHDPTYYSYQIEETTDMCMVGANLSLVMYTITANKPVLLEWLIKHNANLELTMGTGDTALAMAINLGKKEIVELLVKNGANINQQNRLQVNEEVRKKINEFGIVGLYGNIDRTLIFNVHTGKYYTLLDSNTLTLIMGTELDLFENTPLINLLLSDQFTKEEQYNLVKLFLTNGANPNMQDAYGNTPLTFAFPMESKFMKFLLDHGADPSIKDNDGLTVLERMAQTEENEEEEDPEREEKIEILENAMKKQQKK